MMAMKVIDFKCYETNDGSLYENVQPIDAEKREICIRKNILVSIDPATNEDSRQQPQAPKQPLKGFTAICDRKIGIKKFQNVNLNDTENSNGLNNSGDDSELTVRSESDNRHVEPISNENQFTSGSLSGNNNRATWSGTTKFNIDKVNRVFVDGCESTPIQDLALFIGFKYQIKYIMMKQPKLRATHAYTWPNLVQKKSLILIDDFEKMYAYLPAICTLVNVSRSNLNQREIRFFLFCNAI